MHSSLPNENAKVWKSYNKDEIDSLFCSSFPIQDGFTAGVLAWPEEILRRGNTKWLDCDAELMSRWSPAVRMKKSPSAGPTPEQLETKKSKQESVNKKAVRGHSCQRAKDCGLPIAEDQTTRTFFNSNSISWWHSITLIHFFFFFLREAG